MFTLGAWYCKALWPSRKNAASPNPAEIGGFQGEEHLRSHGQCFVELGIAGNSEVCGKSLMCFGALGILSHGAQILS